MNLMNPPPVIAECKDTTERIELFESYVKFFEIYLDFCYKIKI